MKNKTIFSLLLGLGFCINALALTGSDNTLVTIKNSLKSTLPELPVDQINTTPVANVYEVISGRKVFYVDSTGKYAFLGNLVDLTTKQSLTEQKVKQLSLVNWDLLPLNIALVRVIGKGNLYPKRRIAIFTDPDCPFCTRLEQDTIPKLHDVTVYYFLYPLSIHANAENDAKRILCSEIPLKAFTNWMESSVPLLSNTTCHNADTLSMMKDIGKRVVQVEATPTIVLPNGVQVPGLVPPDYLNQLITETSGSKVPDQKTESNVSAKSALVESKALNNTPVKLESASIKKPI